MPLREESEEISNFFQIRLAFAPCFKKGKIGGTENDSVNPSYVDSYAGLKACRRIMQRCGNTPLRFIQIREDKALPYENQSWRKKL